MKNLLIISLLIFGCDSIIENTADAVNYDYCDVVGYNPETCVEVEDECYGAYSEIPNADPENSIVCCCEENN